MKRIAATFALLAVLSGAEQLTAQTLRYRLIDLGTLGGPNSTEGPQLFNILNHPNFGLPFTDSSTPLLGVIGYMAQSSTSLLGNAQSSTSFLGTNQNAAARMIQLKAELRF